MTNILKISDYSRMWLLIKGVLKLSMNSNSNNRNSYFFGLDENVAGLLTYTVGFVSGITFFVLGKNSRFVRFHAMQSILLSIIYVIMFFVLAIIPVIGWFMFILIMPMALILWIAFMIKAYRREYFRIPIITAIVNKQISKSEKQ